MPSNDEEERKARLAAFPKTFVPHSEAFTEDLQIALDFVTALNQGVQTLDAASLPPNEKLVWTKAQDYIKARPIC